MREQLVRYLLGELDAAEQSQLEQQLQASPELRRELAYLKACFSEVNHADESRAELPRGLAERTTERVANAAEDESVSATSLAPGRSAAYASAPDPPAGILGWSLADIAVAGGVFLAISMLLAPALRNSQDASRRNSCANHQRNTYVVIAQYADSMGGRIPSFNRDELAGMFFVHLIGRNYISKDDARQWLVCSGSPLGDAIRNGRAEIFIPSEVELRGVKGDELVRMFGTSTGSYAVPLPSFQNNQLTCMRLNGSDTVPILADGPNFSVVDVESMNHYGGLNVLYSGGLVKFQTIAVVPFSQDRLFLNNWGLPAVGIGPRDNVLVPGNRTPGIELIGNPD